MLLNILRIRTRLQKKNLRTKIIGKTRIAKERIEILNIQIERKREGGREQWKRLELQEQIHRVKHVLLQD